MTTATRNLTEEFELKSEVSDGESRGVLSRSWSDCRRENKVMDTRPIPKKYPRLPFLSACDVLNRPVYQRNSCLKLAHSLKPSSATAFVDNPNELRYSNSTNCNYYGGKTYKMPAVSLNDIPLDTSLELPSPNTIHSRRQGISTSQTKYDEDFEYLKYSDLLTSRSSYYDQEA